MSDDKPDPLKIVPDRDELAATRSSGRKSAGTSGNTGLLWTGFVLLLAGLGAVYYQNIRLSEQVVQQQARLQQADTRIEALEAELTETGQDLSQSGSTLEKRIKDSEFEIRKLWDLSNKRNKVAIAENAEALETVSGRIVELKKASASRYDTLQDSLSQYRQKQDKLAEQQTTRMQQQQALLSRVKPLEQSQQTLQAQLGDIRSQLKTRSAEAEAVQALQKELAQQQEQLKKLQANRIDNSRLAEITITLEVYRERLDAIDAARRQLTGSVTRLNTDVNQLQLQMEKIR